MKRSSVVALALAMGTFAFTGATPVPDPLDALLFAAISAPSSVSYTGIVQVISIGNNAAESAVYRVEHRAPQLTRRVYTAPASLSGDSVLSEGERTFSIDVRRHRIVETRNGGVGDPIALDADYALLRENYRVSRKGEETFDGRRTVDLVLINSYSRRPTMLVRIDAASKIVLDKEMFAADGALVSEVRFEEVRYAGSIPTADFTLPKGYALVRDATLGEAPENPDLTVRRAGFAAREPRSLPDGFAPVEGTLVVLRGVRTVHLLYSDGIRTVSLFENAKASALDAARLRPQSLRIGGHSAEYAEDGTIALLAWSDGSLYYTLVGEVGIVDLRAVAASIAR
jgi:negative regulator of sigma E activity